MTHMPETGPSGPRRSGYGRCQGYPERLRARRLKRGAAKDYIVVDAGLTGAAVELARLEQFGDRSIVILDFGCTPRNI